MRVLYHHWLSPFARKVRLVLLEKRLESNEHVVHDWERDEDFLRLNPTGEVPVFIDADGTVLADAGTIVEYLDEVYPDPPLIGRTPTERAEARRLSAWFNIKFHREVTWPLVTEKLMKRMLNSGAPDSRIVRAGRADMHTHLAYIAWLTERRKWLAGDHLTIADLAAAAHLSLIDYSGDIPWDDHELAKDWYARIKSRPSFRPLLRDTIPNVPPPRHYADLDF